MESAMRRFGTPSTGMYLCERRMSVRVLNTVRCAALCCCQQRLRRGLRLGEAPGVGEMEREVTGGEIAVIEQGLRRLVAFLLFGREGGEGGDSHCHFG